MCSTVCLLCTPLFPPAYAILSPRTVSRPCPSIFDLLVRDHFALRIPVRYPRVEYSSRTYFHVRLSRLHSFHLIHHRHLLECFTRNVPRI